MGGALRSSLDRGPCARPAVTERWSNLLHGFSSVEGVRALVEGWGPWAPVASIGLMVLHSVLPFPAELIAVANGLAFGLLAGVAVTWAGAMLGAVLSFALARRFGRPLVRHLLPARRWAQVEGLMARGWSGGLLVARLLPVVSFNLINYAAGLGGVGWWTFLWTTAIGILPVTVASVLVGSHMITAPPWAWGLLAAAALLLWLAVRLRRRAAAR